jgi:hypothetical protein
MVPHRLIKALLLTLPVLLPVVGPALAGPEPAHAGGGGGVEGPAANPVKGAPASATPSEAQAAGLAGQVAAQSPDGTEEDRKRKQLEIYRLAAEIAQLAAEFGQ